MLLKLKSYIKTIFFSMADLKLAVILFAITFIFGSFYASKNIYKAHFYSHYFAPSVMIADGHGFNNLDINKISELKEFLYLKKKSFSKDKLPDDIGGYIQPLTKFQGVHRYLMTLLGVIWFVFGISWSSAAILCGLLFAAYMVIVYCLFRLVFNRFYAIILLLVISVSMFQIRMIPELRDFSKAPFMLLFFLMMGLYIKDKLSNSNRMHYKAYALNFIAGLTLGIGVGFKIDVLICVPFWIFCVMYFSRYDRYEFKKNALSILLFLLSFAITVFPILGTIFSGANNFHVILLGFMDRYDYALGVKSPLYAFGGPAYDNYIHSMINSYNHLVNGVKHGISKASLDYDSVGGQYFFEIVRNFPADIMIRVYAACAKMLNLGFHGILSLIKGTGLIWALVAFVMISRKSFRFALFLVFAVLYFVGYPMLQFQSRHYFHLEFASLMLLGFIIDELAKRYGDDIRSIRIRKIVNSIRENFSFQSIIKSRSIKHLLLLFIILFVPLWSVRLYQHLHHNKLFQTYMEKSIIKLDFRKAETKKETLFATESFGKNRPVDVDKHKYIQTGYLVIMLHNKRDKNCIIPVRLVYQAEKNYDDLSRTIKIGMKKHETKRVYIPVYYGQQRDFIGISVPRGSEDNIIDIGAFRDMNSIRLFIELYMPPGWESIGSYQRFKL